MTLGERIKARRQKLGHSQYTLADETNIRRPTIAELETNRRVAVSSDILKRLAVALQCSTDYLVGMYEDDEGEEATPRKARRRRSRRV
ncbi:MAG: helix-turn-helix transcriptional regulator [bacterium]|nr:helix-turn-helix transcriptional regulator [bacterium]